MYAARRSEPRPRTLYDDCRRPGDLRGWPDVESDALESDAYPEPAAGGAFQKRAHDGRERGAERGEDVVPAHGVLDPSGEEEEQGDGERCHLCLS